MKFYVTNTAAFKRAVLIGSFIVIFCCTLELVSYYNSSKILYESICQSFLNRAVDNSRFLSDIFNEKLTALKLISEDNDIRSMDWERQKKDLLGHIDTFGVCRFNIIDRNGLAKTTDGREADVSQREYFKEAVSGTANISNLLRSKIDDSLVVVYAVPVKDETGNIAGVLSCAVDYKMLNDITSNIIVGNMGYATLINYDGVIVAHPKKEMVLTMVNISEKTGVDSSIKDLENIIDRKIKGETGFGFYKYENIKNFEAFAPIRGTNWVLGLTVPESEIFSVINSLRGKLILETIIFVVIALLLSYSIIEYFSQKKRVAELQKNADENFRHLAEVTELDKLKTEFFANITHELRTPINVIYGVLQLFEHSMNNVTQHGTKDLPKRIKIVKQNCFRLLRLINNLIDATKIDAGYLELNLKNGDIIRVIENITQSVADYIKEKGIEIVFDTEVEEKVMAFDHDKIERVVLNLLSNAIKFTDANGSISVNLYDKKDKIVISVKDTGIGIPKDKLTIIFERFRQVNQSLTRSHEGSGIGLSLVKSLVEMHEGNVSVRSELGRGSEFIIELPVRVLPEDSNRESHDYYSGSNGYIEKINVEFSDIYFL